MYRHLRPASWITTALLAAVACAGQAPIPATLTAGTQLQADLGSELQSAGAQVGDQIEATLSAAVKQGSTNLPKGTVLSGRVTQAAASTADAGGMMAVIFDRAVTPNGKTYALLAGIESMKLPSSSQPSARGSSPSRGGGGRRGGGYPGGGYPGSTAPSTYPASGTSSTSTTAPVAPTVPDIRFPADAATQGSVLSTQHGDIWVGPGAKLVLQVIAPKDH